MTNIEIFLIVMACAVPIVALLMVLPKIKLKFKKKEKTVKAETKTYAEIKAEEQPIEPKVEEVPKKISKPSFSSDITTDDFKSYLETREPISKPTKNELPDDFIDRTMPYMPRRKKRTNKNSQTISEEIQNLSPELKALIIAGVFNKKDFD